MTEELGNWPKGQKYVFSDEAKELAEKLIPKYHAHLGNANIAYIFKEKNSKKGDKITLATMQKASPKIDFFSEYDLILEIGFEAWPSLTKEQKEACIDHELCHAGFDLDKDQYYIVEHDIEEFNIIIKRHGLWSNSVKQFAETCKEAK